MEDQERTPDVVWTRIVIVGQLVMLFGYIWGIRVSTAPDIIAPSVLAGTGFVTALIGCIWKRRATSQFANSGADQQSHAG